MGIDIKCKVALVTGANRGIGKAILEGFLAADAAKVYAAVRDVSSADALVKEHGDKVVPVELDLAKPDTIQSAAATASDVQIVVNNAGVAKPAGPLDEQTLENLEHEFEVNVRGLIRVAQAFAPVLKANGGGGFAQLNSVASIKTFSAMCTYCASKAASYAVTQALREMLGEQGTQVVSVHPGPINTDMAEEAGMQDVAEPPSVVADALIDAFRQGRFHVFPDSMAKEMGEAYQSFAQNVVEAEMSVG